MHTLFRPSCRGSKRILRIIGFGPRAERGRVTHMRSFAGRSFRVAVAAIALAMGLLNPVQWLVAEPNRAVAETNDAEKQAFEAAKELGTVEAWDAFLSNYSAGFYADLARAYVRKLAEEPGSPAPSSSAPAAAAGGSARPAWCASPGNPAERAICRDADLASLDGVLNVTYKRAKFDSPKSVDEIEHEQKRWLSRRNLCGDDPACIRKRYDEQISLLESFYAN
jgi:uncharacterized protein YecT (DUF1311 family)